MEEKKWYQKTWGIILLLLFFFPAGLYFLWKSEYNKNVKIAGTVAVALLVIYSLVTQEQNKTTVSRPVVQKQSETKAVQPQVATLGLTPAEFVIKYNQQATLLVPQFGLNLPPAVIQDNNTFSWQYNSSGFSIGGIVDNTTGNIKELMILGEPTTQNDSITLLGIYGVTMATLNPELSPEQRGELLRRLGFDSDIDLTQLNSETTVGNFKYSAKFLGNGFGFRFNVSAK